MTIIMIQTMTTQALGTIRNIWYRYSTTDHHSPIKSMLSQFEKNYSRFLESSVISHLNNKKTIIANDELLDLIQIGQDAHRQSDGYFSPFVWTVLEQLWYDAEYSFTKKQTWNIHWSELQIEGKKITLWTNSSFDLWWYGKGYLVDKLATYFQHNNIKDRIIDGGGDIRIQQKKQTVFGSIWILHPKDKELLVAERDTTTWAVTTSSPLSRKRWNAHHIINPQTNEPTTNDLISVTVFASSACLADIASTTLLVWWVEKLSCLASRLRVQYLAMKQDNTIIMSSGILWLHVYV